MAGGNILGREVNGVTVFDEPVLGENESTPLPPPVFDGPGGLPAGWSRLTVSLDGRQCKGFMSDCAAVMPTRGGWYACQVVAGQVHTRRRAPGVFEDHVAAIVAAEMWWPRR